VAPTIEDVAQRAGVSRQTVSRVINGRNWVSADARARVLEAVRVLAYRRNALAGGLRSGRTGTLGLLISNIMNPLFAAEARGVQDVADAHGYQVMFGNTDEDVRKEERLIDMLRQKHVDGAIVIPCDALSHTALIELQGDSIPVVLLNRAMPDFDCVTFDAGRETEHTLTHLIQGGHQRIAIITGSRRSTTARERLSAYRRTLKKHGIAYQREYVKTAGFEAEDARRATAELLELSDPPTAIFATSILNTLGVLRATHELGLTIPDDLAVVGCNESLWSQFVAPPLTMVQTDPYAMGRAGAELLFRRLAGDRADSPLRVSLTSSLEVRASSGPHISRRLRALTASQAHNYS
jgi:LacI family transcriptional regulator